MHGWLGPAQPHGPGWAQPENKKQISSKKFFSKICDFPLYFDQYRFVFLYCKDTTSVLNTWFSSKKKKIIMK
jgi:hypothetical protein